MAADLYEEILGIPAGERPPHHYDLLGIELFESDGRAIHAAGLGQMRELKSWALHPDPATAALVQELLNSVSRACTTLEVPEKKGAYDQELALALGVDLSEKKDYRVLLRPPKLRNCPCGAQMSVVAPVCTSCGFVFSTGQRLKTVFETPSRDASWMATLNRWLKRAVSVAVTLVLVACLVGACYYLYETQVAPKLGHRDYVVEGEGVNSKMWGKFMDDSRLWGVYRAYRRASLSCPRPFLRLAVAESQTHESLRGTTIRYSLEVVDAATGEQLFSGTHSGRNTSGWALAPILVERAAESVLAARGRSDPDFAARVAENVSAPDRAVGKQCLEVLVAIGPPAIPLLTKVAEDGPADVRSQAAKALKEMRKSSSKRGSRSRKKRKKRKSSSSK